PTAAQARTVRLDDCQRRANCHCGIKGVAAVGENLSTDRTGLRMGSGDGEVSRGLSPAEAGPEQQADKGGGLAQRLQAAARGPERCGHEVGHAQALPVMIRYFCISSSWLSTWFSSRGMQSTGQTCWHCGSS